MCVSREKSPFLFVDGDTKNQTLGIACPRSVAKPRSVPLQPSNSNVPVLPQTVDSTSHQEVQVKEIPYSPDTLHTPDLTPSPVGPLSTVSEPCISFPSLYK